MDARPRPSRPGLPWLGRLGPRARIRDLAQPWTLHPVLDPCRKKTPLPSPSDPVPLRFERIKGMVEGTG